MSKINIIPLSANKAWQGKRYSTPLKKAFEEELMYKLPRDLKIPEGKLQIWFVFGVSSKLSDYDNPIKTAQDTIAKFYGFDDRRIYRGLIDKHDVKKGEEFISFQIRPLGTPFIEN